MSEREGPLNQQHFIRAAIAIREQNNDRDKRKREKDRKKRQRRSDEKRTEINSQKRASYAKNSELLRRRRTERYLAHPTPEKTARKEKYNKHPTPEKTAKKEKYQNHPTPQKTARMNRYATHPSAEKRSNQKRYHNNPSPVKRAERQKYQQNAELRAWRRQQMKKWGERHYNYVRIERKICLCRSHLTRKLVKQEEKDRRSLLNIKRSVGQTSKAIFIPLAKKDRQQLKQWQFERFLQRSFLRHSIKQLDEKPTVSFYKYLCLYLYVCI